MLSDRTKKALEGVSTAIRSGAKARKLYKIMRNHDDLWLTAYARIQSNRGALTRGVDGNTLDGFGMGRLQELMASMRDGSYRPKPVRRTYILKDPTNPKGKKRPLGIPTGNDKLVQEVARILLETIYEPIFTDRSHGFRPGRSCHTALREIVDGWKGTKWIGELDIKGYFDNIDHEKMVSILEARIDDQAFINLIELFLKAGYLEDWEYNATYTGTPQGGVISPILANIYLHELDEFMEEKMKAFNKGKRRKPNKEYKALVYQIGRRREFVRQHGETHGKSAGYLAEMEEMSKRLRTLPSVDMHDPGFKRLHYVRYADDFLIGIVGTKEEATQVMGEVTDFVEGSLKLTISREKSRLGALDKGAEFLGYGITARIMPKQMKCKVGTAAGRDVYATKRTVTSHIHLSVPEDRVRSFAQKHGYGTYDAGLTDIRARTRMISLSDFEIVSRFNAELRGFANYYSLAPKYYLNRLEWMAHISLYKTLGRKHDETWGKWFQRMRNDGRSLRFERNGEIDYLPVYSLKDRKKAEIHMDTDKKPNLFLYSSRSELLRRLSANRCEYCGDEDGPFEIHHVRKLKDVSKGTEKWKKLMIQRQRKTLVLCKPCHVDLHRGSLPDNRYAA
ncbi:RNA-dependent DNA polymerase [Komagataeibacter swingsii]|uniref:RNA-dependent DNA polymerase n=1 Tax=Komagataeibacter swingsii TaxID=215220 RepID=A0A850P8Z0_9PROT|nr:RNA-dependent DNA polymerase [Komagataeibacter swingsii]